MKSLAVENRPLQSSPLAGSPRSRRILWIVWFAVLALGVVGVAQRFLQGHLPAGYGSYVPWGLWIALYFHGVGIAGGAFVLGAGGYVLGVPGFSSRVALRTTMMLSLAAIVPAFMGIGLDLGHMERAAFIFLYPRFTSMMAFNAWMYGVFVVLALVAYWLSYQRESSWLKPVLCLALTFSVLFPSQSGAFFGVVDAKPYWNTALLPMVFLASAITAGAATLMLVRALLTKLAGASPEESVEQEEAMRLLRNVVLGGLVVYFAFEFAEFSIALWNPTHPSRALELVLFGPYWWVFWVVHLFLGGVVAFALLAQKTRPSLQLAGALLVAVCFISARLNVLVPGQAVGEIAGLQSAFHHPRLQYTYDATAMEYLVGFFLLAVGMAVFFVGRRVSDVIAARAAQGGR